MQKILFLDIDGVFIPERMYYAASQTYPVYRTFCPSVVGMVNDIAKRTKCKFVVHSSWLCSPRLAGLDVGTSVKDHMISQGLKEEYFHEDWEAKWTRGGNRWEAIYDWLNSHEEVYYFILDDECYSNGNPLKLKNLINTDFSEGFSFADYMLIKGTWANA